ncbi:MAG: recombinase family protein [Clostridiales bacterium]|jgi:DNA invertase Pin-like site-specific DNA recombinase|nr:recombinase family protein [Clostridiales bacterium]
MNNAVIYPRFSSTGQNEMTIEGQIRVCTKFAESRGLTVIGLYDKDKAKSASKETEKRKDLHRMFTDAETGAFQYIIVYTMDRFARNRNESVLFKSQLAKFGVKVLSATEPIADDEGGELYEMFLEWNAEKYSQRLSKVVKNGLTTAVANGTYTGQKVLYGYKLIDSGRRGGKGRIIHKVAIDEEQAPVVRYIFTEYAKGTDKKEIADALNAKGYRIKGKPFKFRAFENWLPNAKYTGEYIFGGRECNNTFPPIIGKALFDDVQKRLVKNKILAGANSAVEPYLLTGKAVCARL